MGKRKSKKPTWAQKQVIADKVDNLKEWRVAEDLSDSLIIRNVHTGELTIIEKPLQVGRPGQRHK